MRGEVVGPASGGVGDPGRQQPVGDGLGVHVGEFDLVQVVDEGGLERLQELGERPGFVLDGQRRQCAVADRAGQFGQMLGKLFRGGDDLAVSQPEGRTPALAPRIDVGLVIGPGKVRGQFVDHGVEV